MVNYLIAFIVGVVILAVGQTVVDGPIGQILFWIGVAIALIAAVLALLALVRGGTRGTSRL